MPMVKLEITKACGVEGESKQPGDVVEVSEQDARYLKTVGKAKDYTAKKAKSPSKKAAK